MARCQLEQKKKKNQELAKCIVSLILIHDNVVHLDRMTIFPNQTWNIPLMGQCIYEYFCPDPSTDITNNQPLMPIMLRGPKYTSLHF